MENNIKNITLKDIINNKLNVVCLEQTTLFLVIDNHLNDFDDIYKSMSEHRYKHSVSVAKTALEIAKANNLNETLINKVFVASILHDIGKDLPMNITLDIMQKYFNNEIKEVHPVVYHQFTGSYIAKEKYLINDLDIINAIKYHTTGNSNMGIIAKIVYCADKIEPTRGYDSKYMIEECKNDIDKGFILTINENIKFLSKKGVKFDVYTHNMIDYYLKK